MGPLFNHPNVGITYAIYGVFGNVSFHFLLDLLCCTIYCFVFRMSTGPERWQRCGTHWTHPGSRAHNTVFMTWFFFMAWTAGRCSISMTPVCWRSSWLLFDMVRFRGLNISTTRTQVSWFRVFEEGWIWVQLSMAPSSSSWETGNRCDDSTSHVLTQNKCGYGHVNVV